MIKKIFPLFAMLALLGCSARRAEAQFIGYTSPQTVSQSIATGASCSPPISQIVPNLGQTVHTVTYTVNNGSEPIFAFIQGSIDGVTFIQISDKSITFPTGSVSATGYYPFIKVQVSCSNPATKVTVQYSGTSVTPGPNFADVDASYYIKNIVVNNQPVNAPFTSPLITSPYGNSSGTLALTFSGAAAPSGAVLQVTCNSNFAQLPPSFSLAPTLGTTQFFTVPPFPCENLVLNYNSNNGTGNYTLTYFFNKPGTVIQTTGVDPCQSTSVAKQTAAINIVAAGTSQVVAPNSNTTVFVCGYQVSVSGTTPTLQWEFATPANCASGVTFATGAIAPTSGSVLTISPGSTVMKGTSGQGFCAVTGGTSPSIQGFLTFVQQ
jgi:hypothetical protein